ncbi:MAG: cytochrome b N-terminal domain-containing protein [Anaerolineales bacterium]|nr:cytochrome b N-terminal domain-containing protein [Anaerolineales bacterium]
MRPSFFHHLHPPTIPAAQSRWRYTLGAGGTALFLMLILGVTGILEMFYYVPTPAEAALSVQTITYHVPFGGFIRNLHYWSAQILLIVSAIHLLRVVFTAAYSHPRRFNYLLGLALFVISILLDFTGYILRWDVDICYPLLTGTNLLKTTPLIGDFLHRITIGGGEACSTGLLRMYTWHIFGLTLPVIVLGIWHAFRVRRDGGIAVPPPQVRADNERISRSELVRREALAMFIVGIAVILLSIFIPAPIAAAMTQGSTITGEAKAPWFFLWIQQMLKWGDPFLWGIVAPLGILTLVALIPYIFPQPADADIGTWFPKSNRLAQWALILISLTVTILTLLANAN